MKKTAALGLGVSLLGASLMGAGSAFAADYKDAPVSVTAGSTAEGSASWTPTLATNVLGAKAQSGPHADSSIAGLGVWPGQSAKYEILVDRDAPAFTDSAGTPRGILGFSVSDQLPAGVTADVKTLSIFDPAAGADGANLISGADYTVTVSKDNVLTVDFSDSWIAANVDPAATARLSVVFTITLAEDAPAYSSPANLASQTITLAGVDQAGVLLPAVVSPEVPVDPEAAPAKPVKPAQPSDSYTFTAANPTSILVPGVNPTEAVLSAVDGSAVGDRVVVGGDALAHTVKLDGTFGETTEAGDSGTVLASAYDVTRFGIVEDYNEALVTIDPASVKVSNAAGEDVTDRFTVSNSAGVLSVLAVTDETTGAVNPQWLVRDYTVEFTTVVRADVVEDAALTSVTTEVVNDRVHPVEAESVVNVKALAPSQTAVAANGSREALDTVPSKGEFFYRIISSEHPANALYPVSFWAAGAELTAGDQQLHDVWSVRAAGDILAADGTVAFADGAVIASNETRSEWFTFRPSGDTMVLEATGGFTSAVSASVNAPATWEVFVSNTRIAAEGIRTSNTAQEYRNDVERRATVTTATGAVVSATPPVDESVTPVPTPTPTPTPAPTPAPAPGDGGTETGAGEGGVNEDDPAAVVPAPTDATPVVADVPAAIVPAANNVVPVANAPAEIAQPVAAPVQEGVGSPAANLANTGTDGGANKALAIGAAILLAAGGAALMFTRRKAGVE